MRLGRVPVDRDVELAYRCAGSGAPIVCLPGWSQAAEQFDALIDELAPRHLVLALDHRGHGGSDQPPSGYRVHRLAADLHATLDGLDLTDVTLLGHSMGAAVTWAYFELFGTERVASLVIADQRPVLLRDESWDADEARAAGATQTFAQLASLCARLRGADGWDTLAAVLRPMVSADLPAERFAALLETNRPTSNATRAALWFDQCTIDWRDLIPRIDVPTLVVHGLGSQIPLSCQEWIAETVPDGQLATIPADEGGSHFAFWENAPRFGAVVADFLG